MGYYQVNSRRRLNLKSCTIVDPKINALFQPLEQVLDQILDMKELVHIFILILLCTGLYWSGHHQLVRLGSALSVAVFNFLVVSVGFGDYIHNISYALPIVFFTLSMSSFAAVLESESGPRSRDR